MRYKIKDIPPEGLVVSQALPPELLAESLEGTDADLARTAGAVHLELSRHGDDIYVRGAVKATVAVPCALCLNPARVTVDAPIKMVYKVEGDAEELDADEDPLDDADFGFYDGDFLDLDPMLREQIILSVPMSPRCREGCRGLCTVCGGDLNETDCGHAPVALEAEPKSVLADQLKKLKLDLKS